MDSPWAQTKARHMSLDELNLSFSHTFISDFNYDYSDMKSAAGPIYLPAFNDIEGGKRKLRTAGTYSN